MSPKSSTKKICFYIGRGSTGQQMYDEFAQLKKEMKDPKNEDFLRGVLNILKEEQNYKLLQSFCQNIRNNERAPLMSPPPRKVSLVSLVSPGSSLASPPSDITSFGSSSCSVVLCKSEEQKQTFLAGNLEISKTGEEESFGEPSRYFIFLVVLLIDNDLVFY